MRGFYRNVKAKISKPNFPCRGIKALNVLYDIFETYFIKYKYDKNKGIFQNESLFNYENAKI